MEKCDYKLLHQSAIGNVSYCAGCGNLKIRIGHLMSFISEDSFSLIIQDFEQRKEFYQQVNEMSAKPERVVICLNKNNLFLNLSYQEFDEVNELFHLAYHMLEVNSYLNYTA